MHTIFLGWCIAKAIIVRVRSYYSSSRSNQSMMRVVNIYKSQVVGFVTMDKHSWWIAIRRSSSDDMELTKLHFGFKTINSLKNAINAPCSATPSIRGKCRRASKSSENGFWGVGNTFKTTNSCTMSQILEFFFCQSQVVESRSGKSGLASRFKDWLRSCT